MKAAPAHLANRRGFLIAASASVAVLPALSGASASTDDPLLALIAEWHTVEATLDTATSNDDAADQRLFDRQVEIELTIMDGVAPTTLAGVIAALSFARREVANYQIEPNCGPVAASVVYEADPGSGLACHMLDVSISCLPRIGA